MINMYDKGELCQKSEDLSISGHSLGDTFISEGVLCIAAVHVLSGAWHSQISGFHSTVLIITVLEWLGIMSRKITYFQLN